MAFKNLELNDMSRFGDRLLVLMKEKTASCDMVCDTAPKLARYLYDKKLIVPRRHRRGDADQIDDDENTLSEKAIGTITKQIQKHINSSDCTSVSGEYIAAYCCFFSCSADYLFGYTKIHTKKPSIRKICEATGLSEKAVNSLVGNNDELSVVNSLSKICWSQLIESNLFSTIPHDFLAAKNEANEFLRHKAAIDAIHAALKGKEESIAYSLVAIKEKPIQKGLDAHYAAYYGMLYKLAQNITTELDKLIDSQASDENIYKKYLKKMEWQYRTEYAVANNETPPPKPDGEFQFDEHFIV